MSEKSNSKKVKKIVSGSHMTRREIVDAVTEPDSFIILGKESPKTIAIPTNASIKADLKKLNREMNVVPDSLMDKVIRLFCAEKKASDINAKIFIMRIKNMNNEQLKVVGLLCHKNEFTATNILKAVQSIKKFDAARLLALRAFIDLEGIGPGPLNQFFVATLPQCSPGEVERHVYENEVLEKRMTPVQNTVFYNICNQVKGITPSDAISFIPKVRKLKKQHAEMMNTYLKEGAVFGEDLIDSGNILKLINLWLTIPQLKQEKTFKRITRQFSKKFKQQADFKVMAQSFIQAALKEKSGGGFWSFILRFFN